MMHSLNQLDGCTVRLESGGPHASATFEELNPIIKAVQYRRNNVIRYVVLENEAKGPLRICSTLSERFGSQFAAYASMSLRRVGSIALALATLACFRPGVVEAHGRTTVSFRQ